MKIVTLLAAIALCVALFAYNQLYVAERQTGEALKLELSQTLNELGRERYIVSSTLAAAGDGGGTLRAATVEQLRQFQRNALFATDYSLAAYSELLTGWPDQRQFEEQHQRLKNLKAAFLELDPETVNGGWIREWLGLFIGRVDALQALNIQLADYLFDADSAGYRSLININYTFMVTALLAGIAIFAGYHRQYVRDTDEARQILQKRSLELTEAQSTHKSQSEDLARERAALEEAEQRYRNINHLLPVGLMTVDQKGRIREVNRQACELFGYSEEELLGMSVEELVPEASRGKHPRLRENFAHSTKPRIMAANYETLAGRRKDGTLVPLEIGLAPITLNGEPLVVTSLLNVAERRRSMEQLQEKNAQMDRALDQLRHSNEQLAEAEQRYRNINLLLPVGLMTVDSQGQIQEVNRQTCELFGYSEEELLSMHVEQLVPEASRDRHPRLRESFAHSTKPRIMAANFETLAGRRKDGTLVPLEIGLAPITLDGERLIVTSLLNVEERRRSMEQLQEKTEQMDLALDRLRRSNEQLERFAFICSHDLQEPVRMVLSFSQLLKKNTSGQLDEKALGYLNHITDGAQRARDMISDILAFCRLDRNTDSYSKVDLATVCEQVHSTLEVTLEEKNAVFEWSNTLPTVDGVPTQLFQLFLNLVSNGIKFNRSPAPRVEVKGAVEGGHWVVTVEDNGIGIEPQYIHKLFQIFTRLNSKAEFPGTGIGLAICKKIAEQHGAGISVESEPGQGSRFVLTWLNAATAQQRREA